MLTSFFSNRNTVCLLSITFAAGVFLFVQLSYGSIVFSDFLFSKLRRYSLLTWLSYNIFRLSLVSNIWHPLLPVAKLTDFPNNLLLCACAV